MIPVWSWAIWALPAMLAAPIAIASWWRNGGEIMMAMFFAQRVILGKTEFAAVPAKLKAGVAEVLIDSGLPELVPVEYEG